MLEHAVKGNSFLHSTLVGDESCWHYFDPETKWQSMVWHHTILLKKKMPKQSPHPSRPWELSSGLLKDAYWLNFCHEETLDAAGYCRVLQKLCHALWDKPPGKKQIILQHNAQCTTLLLSVWRRFRRTAENFYPIHLTAWTLHPCTTIFFSFIKDFTCGQHYVTDKAVQEAIWCLWTAEMEFYCTSGMVAKVRQSGWGFCTEVNTVHRFEWHALF